MATITDTVGSIASAGTVTGVVSPVTDAADDLISALPVVDSVLGRAPVGSIVDPVTDGLDDLLDTSLGLVTPRIDGVDDAAGGPLDGPTALERVVASSAVRSGDPTATAEFSVLRTALFGGRQALSASIPALPSTSIRVTPTGGEGPTPGAPVVFAAGGFSGTASAGSGGGQPSSLAALTSDFSFTLAVGIRSVGDAGARAFSLSYDPSSSPD